MAEEGPNGVLFSQQHFENNEARAPSDAGRAGVLRDDSHGTDGDGSGRAHDSAGIRGHQDGLESHAHSYSPTQAASYQSRNEGTLRPLTPIQSTNYSHSPSDHYQLRAASVSGVSGGYHEGFVRPSSYLRRPRAYSRPMTAPKQPETAVDREQRRSLVSGPCK